MGYRKDYQVERTADGIMEHLCNMMELVAKRTVTLDEAKQQGDLAKQANNVLRFKLDEQKFLLKRK